MRASELLERCRAMQAERRDLIERIQRWRDSATRMGGGRPDSTGVHGGGSGDDRMLTIMGEITRLEELLGQRERAYAAELTAVNRLLDSLPDLQRAIMARYYVDGMALSAVARAIGYSYGYVRVQKKDACARLEQIPAMRVNELLPGWYVSSNMHPK